MSEPIDDGYPVVVRLAGRRVLIVGGGQIALRKARGVLAAGAAVTVVSPDVVPELAALPSVVIHRRRFEAGDLDGAMLVIAATNDPDAQQQIFEEGERRGIFVNAVDDPDRCSFVLPAVHRRGPVIIAVSTQGRSPTLAGRLRDLLADAMPADIEALAAELAEQRRAIQARGESTEDVEWPDPLARRSVG